MLEKRFAVMVLLATLGLAVIGYPLSPTFFHTAGLTSLRFCLSLLFNSKSFNKTLYSSNEYRRVGDVAILKRRPTYRREHKASLLKCCFVASAHRQSEFG